MTCTVVAELGDIVFDGSTADSDGVVWSFDWIDGWWDSTEVDSTLLDVMYGQIITGAHENGRAMILRGAAFMPDPHPPLADKFWIAERHLKRATRLVYVPGLLEVTEPDIGLQASVFRNRKAVVKRVGAGPLIMEFEIPLLAEDPRRYDQTVTTNTDLQLTGSGTTDSATVANAGDQPTAPTITIDGPATNPKVTNATDGGKFVEYAGVLGGGDTLVLDSAAQTAKVNGSDVIITPTSQFFSLLPGNNSITYARTAGSGTTTAQLDYRHAYS